MQVENQPKTTTWKNTLWSSGHWEVLEHISLTQMPQENCRVVTNSHVKVRCA